MSASDDDDDVFMSPTPTRQRKKRAGRAALMKSGNSKRMKTAPSNLAPVSSSSSSSSGSTPSLSGRLPERPLSEHGKALAEELVEDQRIKDSRVDWERNKSLDAEATKLLTWYKGSLELQGQLQKQEDLVAARHDQLLPKTEEEDDGNDEDDDGDVPMRLASAPALVDSDLPAAATSAVEDLGHGVHAYLVQADGDGDLDGGTACTVVREDTRHVAREALDMLLELCQPDGCGPPSITASGVMSVLIIGHVGASAGELECALQELLWRGEVVVRVRRSCTEMDLFVPDGASYRGWSTSLSEERWNVSDVLRDARTFVLMDSPEPRGEDGLPSVRIDTFFARTIKYVPVDAPYRMLRESRAQKICFASLPSEEEMVAMTPKRWSKATPFPGQEELNDAEKEAEVRKRCRLVGCLPGLVFNAKGLALHLSSVLVDYEPLKCLGCLQGDLCLFALGMTFVTGAPGLQTRHGKHFLFDCETGAHQRMWMTLSPVASYLLHDTTDKLFSDFRWRPRLFSCIPPKLLRLVEPGRHVVVRPASGEASISAILELPDDNTSTIVAPGHFFTNHRHPALDFVTSRLRWYIGYAGHAHPKVRASAFVAALLALKLAQKKNGTLEMVEKKVIELIVLRTREDDESVEASILENDLGESRHSDLSYEQVAALFGQHVHVTMRCVPADLAGYNAETGKLLAEFQQLGAMLDASSSSSSSSSSSGS